MPVVKMGSGAQTQAKHCRGRGEGDRFGCQVRFTFLSVLSVEWGKRKRESETCCFSLLTSVFFCYWDGSLEEALSQNQRKAQYTVWTTRNHCTHIFTFSHHITEGLTMLHQLSHKICCVFIWQKNQFSDTVAINVTAMWKQCGNVCL